MTILKELGKAARSVGFKDAAQGGGIIVRRGKGPRAATFLFGLASALFFSVNGSRATTDAYTGSFFTRGSYTGHYLESGDPIYDPLYVPLDRWSLVPRVTVVATREDNLFLSARKTRGVSVQVVPGAVLIWGRPEANHLFADFGAIIPVYDSSDQLDDRPSYLFTLGGVVQTVKSQVALQAGYRRLENSDTLVGARIVKQDYIANLTLDHHVSAKSSVGLHGGIEQHDFESAQYVDYQRLYGAARLYKKLTAMSEGFFQAGLGRDDLDTGPGNYGDATFYDFSLGIRGKPSPKTSATGRVGYQWRTFEDDGLEDIEHWIASLGAETNPFGFTTFSTELFADIRPAVNAAGSSTIDQRWTVSASRRLFVDRLRGAASLFLGRVDYRSPNAEPRLEGAAPVLIYDRRRDEYWGYTLGLDWWPRQNISMGLNYSYVDNRAARNADEAIQRESAYDSGRWMLRVSWNY